MSRHRDHEKRNRSAAQWAERSEPLPRIDDGRTRAVRVLWLAKELRSLGVEMDDVLLRCERIAKETGTIGNVIPRFLAAVCRAKGIPPSENPSARAKSKRNRERKRRFYEGLNRFEQIISSRPLKPPGKS